MVIEAWGRARNTNINLYLKGTSEDKIEGYRSY